jgi:hypothetical protein
MGGECQAFIEDDRRKKELELDRKRKEELDKKRKEEEAAKKKIAEREKIYQNHFEDEEWAVDDPIPRVNDY